MGAPCLVNVVKEWPPKRKAELQLGDKRKAEKESLGSCRSIKLRYSEKAKMFWKKVTHFVLTLLINFKTDFSKWIFFLILWPSHDSWTLLSSRSPCSLQAMDGYIQRTPTPCTKGSKSLWSCTWIICFKTGLCLPFGYWDGVFGRTDTKVVIL